MKQSNINLILTFEIARYRSYDSFEMWILTLYFNTLTKDKQSPIANANTNTKPWESSKAKPQASTRNAAPGFWFLT